MLQGQRHQEELLMLIQTPPPNYPFSVVISHLETERCRIYDETIYMTHILNMMLTYKNNFMMAHQQYWKLQRSIATNYQNMKKEMEREVEVVRDALRNVSQEDHDIQLKLQALKREVNKCGYNEQDNNQNN